MKILSNLIVPVIVTPPENFAYEDVNVFFILKRVLPRHKIVLQPKAITTYGVEKDCDDRKNHPCHITCNIRENEGIAVYFDEKNQFIFSFGINGGRYWLFVYKNDEAGTVILRLKLDEKLPVLEVHEEHEMVPILLRKNKDGVVEVQYITWEKSN